MESDILSKIESVDNQLFTEMSTPTNEKQTQIAIRNGLLDYTLEKLKSSENRGLLKRQVTQALYDRMQLPVDDPQALTTDQLIQINDSENMREVNEMKILVGLIKQQFINIKVTSSNNNPSPDNNPSKTSENRLTNDDVNSIRNVLNFIKSKIEKEKEVNDN